MCGAMLLEHIGEAAAGARIRSALEKAIAKGALPADLAAGVPNAKVVGCREFGEIVGACL